MTTSFAYAVFIYGYRDRSGQLRAQRCIVPNDENMDLGLAQSLIKRFCHDGNLFSANQVGLDVKFPYLTRPAQAGLDHGWHEFIGLGQTHLAGSVNLAPFSLIELINRFERQNQHGWQEDVGYMPIAKQAPLPIRHRRLDLAPSHISAVERRQRRANHVAVVQPQVEPALA